LHPSTDLDRRFGRLRFLGGDHALAADLLHRVGDQFADPQIIVRRDRRHLDLLAARADRAQHLRAKVLLGILEVELLGNGHAVVADDRRASALLEQNRF
jgi:hypothetical protein